MLISHRIAARIAALLIVVSPAARAQTVEPLLPDWEVRLASGAMMPTGDQRHDVRSGPLTAAQVSWLPKSSLAFTGTLGWARSRDRASVGTPRLNAFSADFGVEARPSRWIAGGRVSFSPFIGLGAGSRSYDYRGRRADARHNLAGYGALGGELGVGRLGLRVEARNYVSRFKPLAAAGKSDARSDVFVLVALRFNRRATQP